MQWFAPRISLQSARGMAAMTSWRGWWPACAVSDVILGITWYGLVTGTIRYIWYVVVWGGGIAGNVIVLWYCGSGFNGHGKQSPRRHADGGIWSNFREEKECTLSVQLYLILYTQPISSYSSIAGFVMYFVSQGLLEPGQLHADIVTRGRPRKCRATSSVASMMSMCR